MMDLFERDPEEIGPEHPEDYNARMNLIDAVHSPDMHNGKCKECGREYWSVLHYNDEIAFRDRHDHGGGDCMCFEFEDD